MSLPGKKVLSLLEEDNPLKSYFHVIPLFVLEAGTYVPVSDGQAQFPDNGGIRIVPDKNESSRFKARMRTLGRYCAIDLTDHPNENDKIRPNKNYHPERGENNQLIVYSDVISELTADTAVEVYPAFAAAEGSTMLDLPIPGTHHIALLHAGRLTGPWKWRAAEDHTIWVERDREYEFCDQDTAECADIHTVRLCDGSERAVRLSSDDRPLYHHAIESASQASKPASLAGESATLVSESATLIRKPVTLTGKSATLTGEPAMLTSESVSLTSESAALASEPASLASEPASLTGESSDTAHEEACVSSSSSPAAEAQSAPQAIPAIASAADNAEPISMHRALTARYALRDPALRAQSGLNPRRNKSLSEIIDDQWRKSRLDQLGHPVPGAAMGKPLISPIEQAAQAAQAAWALPKAREGLLRAILQLDGLSTALTECCASLPSEGGTPARHESLDELEAERLHLLDEIDSLKRARAEKKAALMEEVKNNARAEIAKLEAQRDALCKETESAASEAKAASECLARVNDTLSEDIDRQILAHAGALRTAQLIRNLDVHACPPPETYDPSAGELVCDMRTQMAAAGFAINNDDMLALLAALTIGKILIISGAPGTGKSTFARALAAALGLCQKGHERFIAIPPGKKKLRKISALHPLLQHTAAAVPGLILLDDANTTAADDITRGYLSLLDDTAFPTESTRLMLTVQDDPHGYPLCARLLDRAFFIRLDGRSLAQEWRAPACVLPTPACAVSLETLRRTFAGTDELPGEMMRRMETLRIQLEKWDICLTRRTLTDTYANCAALLSTCKLTADAVLDLTLAERVLPSILASAPLTVLKEIPRMIPDMPRCLHLMEQPLALPPLESSDEL